MTSPDASERNRKGRAKKLFAVTATALLAALALAIPALAATPPVPPNNIVIFPERDFVVLEGYEALVGQSVTVTVTRGNQTTSTASGTVGAGDPSLEINHPGGVCWTGVTPNIKPGDEVTAAFSGGQTDSATTINVTAGDASRGANGTPNNPNDDRLIVKGTARDADAPNGRVRIADLEQRIIQPELNTTRIDRRDIRADSAGGRVDNVPGGRGDLRYDSPTSVNWTATYTGLNDREIRLALQGQVRVLSWMDFINQERAGITIFERGEVGGPGFGGCPQGPEASAPNAPRNVSATAGNRSVTATWDRPILIPDGGAITGYRVTAIRVSNDVETSVNVAANARTATITPLVNGADYNVQVQARSGPRFSQPGTAGPVTPAPPGP